MIDHVLSRETYELAKRMLDAAALRQEALAANIANAETPGFKRLDLASDFAQQLAQISKRPSMGAIQELQPRIAEDLASRAVRSDGNNVQLDRELVELSRNSMEYEFLAQYASDSLRRLKTAISGRVQ